MAHDYAIIGLKGHESVVINGAKQLGDWRLVAIADDVPAELQGAAKKYPEAQTYSDWRMLLQHAMPEVVCLSDSNDLHAEQVIACAERKLKFVSEKPLALNLTDLQKVAAAIKKSNVTGTMLLTMRHEAKYPTVRQLIADGAIGEVAQVTAQKSYRLETRPAWFKSKQRLGGIIPYIGIHPVDLIRWTTGLDFARVAAHTGQLGKFEQLGESDNHASLLAELSNGASCTIRLDYLRPSTTPTHGDDCLRIAGTQGIIECRGDEPQIMLSTTKAAPTKIKPGAATNLFAEFWKAVAAEQPVPIPLSDCLRATEIVLLADQAAREKTWVKVPAPSK
jgi:predicted dehydrogenase